jgi:hypothetical protein
MEYKIKCNTIESKDIQRECFKHGITWPGGGTEVESLMGNEQYLFIDSEFVWSENIMSFENDETYKEISIDDLMNELESFEQNIKPLEPLVELKEGFIAMTPRELINKLMAGELMQGDMYAKYCYCMYDESFEFPFRFIDMTEEESNDDMSACVWREKGWKVFEKPTILSLEEIEEKLGYKIKIEKKENV